MAGLSMAAATTTYALLVFFSLCCLPPPAGSVSFNYSAFSKEDLKDIRVERDANIDSGLIEVSANRLTGIEGSRGRASYNHPVPLWDSAGGEAASFTTRFSFVIYPPGERGIDNKGTGMAFFLAGYPSSLPENSPFWNIGLTNQSAGTTASGEDRFVAVEFDTFPDTVGAGVIAGATGGVALFALLCVTAALFVRRRNNMRKKIEEDIGSEDEDGEPIMEIEMGTGPRRFPYDELLNATRSFAFEAKLGQGGFGAVYRGYLQDLGLAVAIKRFAKESSMQGREEYKSEIKVISRLRHRNLVQLIGWCHSRHELLLVYELMPNRSLDIHLYSKDTFLTWPMRVKIVLGLGSALLYLHEEWEQCVVHRDIKPSNVMLDESFNAKLGDFGLARLIDHAVGMQP